MSKITITFLVLLVGVAAQSAAWNEINTGKITPVTSFSGNTSYSSYAYSITHTVPSSPVIACIALISYDALLSTTFTFNSTLVSLNSTSVEVNIQTYSTTYFKTLSYHYLITSHATIQIINLCYYTSTLFSGSGDRNQSFINATTTFSGDYLQLVTVFTGMKMSNTNGDYFYIQATSDTSALPTITTVISTKENNLVEWACVALVVYNPKTTIVGQFYFRDSSNVGYTPGFSAVTSIDPAYQLLNTMFFGLSLLEMSLVRDSTQKFIMDSGSTTPLASPDFSQNQVSLMLEQLYFWTDGCISTPTNLVPISGVTCVSVCISGYYDNGNQYCVECSITTGFCMTCSSSDCTTCDSSSPTFRTLDTTSTPNVCVCMTGYFDPNGTCTLCSDYLDYCTECTSATSCTTCTTGFTVSGGVCVCDPGTYLVNGNCQPLMGCLQYNLITSGYYCIDGKCDTDNHFEMLPNKTCQCLANTVFNSSTGKCQGICSDGVSLGNDCDLGAQNGVSGSGCSATCTVESGYHCSSPNTTSSSVCVNITAYSGQYLYATRDLTSNTAKFYVQLSPNDAYLPQMNFNSLVKTSFSTSKLTATFDSSTGILTIEATYTENIEGTQQLFNISFDETKIYSPSVVIYQMTEGVNARLDYSTFEAYNSIIYYFSMFVGGSALLLAIVSGILGYKLIGFEICLPLQVTYFSMLLLNVPQASISSMYGMELSSGYNRLEEFDLQQNLNINKGLIVLQRSDRFLQNCNYSYIPLVVLLVLSAVTHIWVKEKVEEPKKGPKDSKKKKKDETKPEEEPNTQQSQPVEEANSCEKAHFFIVDRILVTYWVLLILNSVFSFGLQLQSESEGGKFSSTASVAAAGAMMALALAGLVFIALKIKERDKKVTFRSKSWYYPVFYISTQVGAVLLIIASFYASTAGIFTVVIPQLFALYWLFRLNPHGKLKTFQSIVALLCQIVALLSTMLFIMAKYITDPMISTVAAFMILILYTVAEALSIARLVRKYRQDKANASLKSSEDKVKIEAENLEALTYSSIKNHLMNNTKDKMNWEAINEGKVEDKPTPGKDANYEKLESCDGSDEEKEGDEEDELRRLKRRLKKQIHQKRNMDI